MFILCLTLIWGVNVHTVRDIDEVSAYTVPDMVWAVSVYTVPDAGMGG